MMNIIWKETPHTEFPSSLEEEKEYVRAKKSHIPYPSYDTAFKLYNTLNIRDSPYDTYIHNACMILYNNLHSESIIKKVGVSVNNKYGINGLRTVHTMVYSIAGFMTTYRLVYAHAHDFISGCFDGIGGWKC